MAGAMDKVTGAITGKLFPVVTILLIFVALVITVFIPGALIGGLAILILLLIKFFVGKSIASSPVSQLVGGEKTTPGVAEEEAAVAKPAAQSAAKSAVGAAGKSNIWALIISYFITPMGDLECSALALGWICYPIAVITNISLIVASFCTITGGLAC